MDLIPYASRTGTRRNLAALRAGGWGLLISATGTHSNEGFAEYMIDCGSWTLHNQAIVKPGKKPPRIWKPSEVHRAFIHLVLKLGAGARSVVVPDIVAGGMASLALTIKWLPWVLAHAPRALIAVQNGMVPSDVAHLLGDRVGLFVGGDTQWKLATMAQWGSLAIERGVWCHVGRVNSDRRIQSCAAAGVSSFDGTNATRFSVNIPGLNRAVRFARTQQFLDLSNPNLSKGKP